MESHDLGSDLQDNWTDLYDSFSKMGLSDDLLQGVHDYGFTNPSPVQQRAIVPFARGRDLILRAFPGTSRTSCFAIGLLTQLDYTQCNIQALVLTPTRELAMSTEWIIASLGQHLGVIGCVCVGGTRVKDGIEAIKRGAHVVVGTPGRISDMIHRRVLKTDTIRIVVLDAADDSISTGFFDQLYDIFITLPHSVLIWVTTATIPKEIMEIFKWMKDPVRITVIN